MPDVWIGVSKQSRKGFACRAGMSFRTGSPIELTQWQQHPQQQNVECVGCRRKFARAGDYMKHIEDDECTIIRAEHFERQRAEKQLLRDAFEAQIDPMVGSVLPSMSSQTSDPDLDRGGVSVLDSANLDQIDAFHDSTAIQTLQPTKSTSYRAPRPPLEGMGRLALSNFPALSAQTNSRTATRSSNVSHIDDEDLLDWDQKEQRTLHNPRWIGCENVARLLSSENYPAPKMTTAINLGTVESICEPSTAATGTLSERPPNMISKLSELSGGQSIYGPEGNDPNALHSHIQTTPAISPRSILDPEEYYHVIEQKYVCPGAKCNRKYDTPEEFSKHLLSGAHIGGKTQCPACLKRFKSTYALITHCESGTRRCQIRKAPNYSQVLRELTAGFIGTDGFLADGTVRYTANKVEDW